MTPWNKSLTLFAQGLLLLWSVSQGERCMQVEGLALCSRRTGGRLGAQAWRISYLHKRRAGRQLMKSNVNPTDGESSGWLAWWSQRKLPDLSDDTTENPPWFLWHLVTLCITLGISHCMIFTHSLSSLYPFHSCGVQAVNRGMLRMQCLSIVSNGLHGGVVLEADWPVACPIPCHSLK